MRGRNPCRRVQSFPTEALARPVHPNHSVSQTIDADTVINLQDEDLGKLEHIMLDVPSGRISYAVLACGGVFGIGEKLVVVPWGALTLDAERKCFVLDIDRAGLENSPGFLKDRLK